MTKDAEHESPNRAQIKGLDERIRQLERIIAISQTLNTTLELDPLLESIVKAAAELTDTVGCGILLLDEGTGQLRFRVATGPNRDGLVGSLVPLDGSIAGWIVRENKPLLLTNPQQDERFFPGMDEATDFQTHSIMGVPLQVKGEVIGVLEAVNKRNGQLMTETDLDVLAILADQAAVAIENAQLYDGIRRLNEFNEALVQDLAEGIVVTDPDGLITFLNPALAKLLGYPPEELLNRNWSAIVPPDQRSIVEQALARRRQGESDRYKLELLCSDGRRTPVFVSGNPRFTPDGSRFTGSIAVFTDIREALARQRIEQELALAWQIQASFLPDQLPEIDGWQLSAALEPARQTSGDFYDLISLPNGRLGLLIADVAGKGMGAALYMAVCRTLLRTYAVEFHSDPRLVLRAANLRILRDSEAELFVTAFYGVLDPVTGRFTYCNAGHNPPYLFRSVAADAIEALSRTGLPLGIFESLAWEQRTVQVAPGDVIVLYTDGITDAEDENGVFFGQERLRETALVHRQKPAADIQTALLEQVRAFTGRRSRAPHDDIALIVVSRNAS
jgi:PAS domain S-box-containing protein